MHLNLLIDNAHTFIIIAPGSHTRVQRAGAALELQCSAEAGGSRFGSTALFYYCTVQYSQVVSGRRRSAELSIDAYPRVTRPHDAISSPTGWLPIRKGGRLNPLPVPLRC